MIVVGWTTVTDIATVSCGAGGGTLGSGINVICTKVVVKIDVPEEEGMRGGGEEEEDDDDEDDEER